MVYLAWRIIFFYIDSEENFQMMKFIHRYYCENDEGIKQIYEASRAFLLT